ncbi:g10094 [Coccomyxa elongata]
MSSGHPSRPHHPRDDDEVWCGVPATWGRVLLGVAAGVIGTLLVLKWTDKDASADDVARDLKHSAEAKTREIKDSWSR